MRMRKDGTFDFLACSGYGEVGKFGRGLDESPKSYFFIADSF